MLSQGDQKFILSLILAFVLAFIAVLIIIDDSTLIIKMLETLFKKEEPKTAKPVKKLEKEVKAIEKMDKEVSEGEKKSIENIKLQNHAIALYL